MKIEKNKIVFGTIIGIVIIFIITYSMMVFQDEKETELNSNKIPIPELQDQQKEYKSKLDAIDNLKEVQQRDAPSIYDEKLLDSNGIFDPDLLDKEKTRIVDSIYNQGRINYTKNNYRNIHSRNNNKVTQSSKNNIKLDLKKDSEDLLKRHDIFYKSTPKKEIKATVMIGTDSVIHVVVNGDQVVKTNSRLEMRLTRTAIINKESIPKNTYLYGFVSFKPNRTLIHITNILHKPVSLKAFDLQDGNEGIYVVNNFKVEVSKAVVDDLVDNINIPGIPSIDVFKNVFQHSSKKTKVTITNDYHLLLKPKL